MNKNILENTEKYLDNKFSFCSGLYAEYSLKQYFETTASAYLDDMKSIKFLQNLLNAYKVNIEEFLPKKENDGHNG